MSYPTHDKSTNIQQTNPLNQGPKAATTSTAPPNQCFSHKLTAKCPQIPTKAKTPLERESMAADVPPPTSSTTTTQHHATSEFEQRRAALVGEIGEVSFFRAPRPPHALFRLLDMV